MELETLRLIVIGLFIFSLLILIIALYEKITSNKKLKNNLKYYSKIYSIYSEFFKNPKNSYIHKKNTKYIISSIYINDKLHKIKDITELYKDVSKNNINFEFEEIIVENKKIQDFMEVKLNIGKNDKIKKILNSGLINSVIISSLSSTSKNSIDKSSIVGIMVGDKISRDTKSYIFLLLSIVVYFLYCLFTSSFPIIPISLIIIFIAALSLNQKMLEIRIKNGSYGNNAYEAREIIEFIQEHTNKDDFTDGNNTKKIMPEIEKNTKEIINWNGEALI